MTSATSPEATEGGLDKESAIGVPGTVRIRPTRGLLDLDLASVWRYRGLLFFLVWRDVKIRYKQAALGAGWAIIQPVLSVLIFTVVFGNFAGVPSDGVPYPLFSFAAMLPWTYFAEALNRSSNGLVNDAQLVKKIYFPRLMIPLSGVIGPLVDFAITFLVLLVVMAWYGYFPTVRILLLPLFVLVAMGMALTAGLFLGPLNVRFRDVRHTLPFLVQVWMYASPIVYPLSIVPERWRLVYSLNPMVGVIEGFRWVLLGEGSPDLQAISIGMGLIAIGLGAGLVYFRKYETTFADVI